MQFAVVSALAVEPVAVVALLWMRKILPVVLADYESCVAAEAGPAAEAGFAAEELSLQRR